MRTLNFQQPQRDSQEFSARLFRARIDRGLTQDQMSEMLGICKWYVSKFERGQITPKKEIQEKISAKLCQLEKQQPLQPLPQDPIKPEQFRMILRGQISRYGTQKLATCLGLSASRVWELARQGGYLTRNPAKLRKFLLALNKLSQPQKTSAPRQPSLVSL